MTKRSLAPILEQTWLLHQDLAHLWEEVPEPGSRRALAVRGFCEIVRQHTISQAMLAGAGLDVSATTLVRPAFEALVRAIWCMRGAKDEWVESFLTPTAEVVGSDAETVIGPGVQKMLDELRPHHPAYIHQELVRLKEVTWRAMHSYVHGGIRPVMQATLGFQEHEVAGVVTNANGMLLTATNVERMVSGLRSPQLPLLQTKHAICLPNVA